MIDLRTKKSHFLAKVPGKMIVGLAWWRGEPKAVSPRGKISTIWGAIKTLR